jgi:hypothetical protein
LDYPEIKYGRGKIARIRNGLPYFAFVELTIRDPISEPIIEFECRGKGAGVSQGNIEEVPAGGRSYDDWKQGAFVGITYALARCAHAPCHVTITRIAGLTSDTNPTIVGGAAIQAAWTALEYSPTPEEQATVDDVVFGSYAYPYDHIPDFG